MMETVLLYHSRNRLLWPGHWLAAQPPDLQAIPGSGTRRFYLLQQIQNLLIIRDQKKIALIKSFGVFIFALLFSLLRPDFIRMRHVFDPLVRMRVFWITLQNFTIQIIGVGFRRRSKLVTLKIKVSLS